LVLVLVRAPILAALTNTASVSGPRAAAYLSINEAMIGELQPDVQQLDKQHLWRRL
jgi:hypothetical protein